MERMGNLDQVAVIAEKEVTNSGVVMGVLYVDVEDVFKDTLIAAFAFALPVLAIWALMMLFIANNDFEEEHSLARLASYCFSSIIVVVSKWS